MAFFEVHRGYVGLGSTVVFRTAEQAARDIETFGKDVAELQKQGGTRNLETVFRYAATSGRMEDINSGMTATANKLKALGEVMAVKLKELNKLGVKRAGQMAAELGVQIGIMVASMAAGGPPGWIIAGIGTALQYFGVIDFTMTNAKRRRIGELTRELDALEAEMKQLVAHGNALFEEGERLSKVASERPEEIVAKIVQIPKKVETVKSVYDSARQRQHNITKIVDVKDPFQATYEELQRRETVAPSGARLPEGFQLLYSPKLKMGPIVTQSLSPAAQPTKISTVGQRAVYGGLAGVGESRPDVLFMYMAFLGGLWVLSQVAEQPHYARAR